MALKYGMQRMYVCLHATRIYGLFVAFCIKLEMHMDFHVVGVLFFDLCIISIVCTWHLQDASQAVTLVRPSLCRRVGAGYHNFASAINMFASVLRPTSISSLYRKL